MEHTPDIRTTGLPDDMQLLLQKYPRDTWHTHPGFQDKTRQWMGAHLMFRHLSAGIREDTESYLDQQTDDEHFASSLASKGNALVGSLHGHHNWEDRSYFPELSKADPRFDKGLEILETDHAAIDEVLDGFTRTANRTIKLMQLDPGEAQREAGDLHSAALKIEAFLERHLTDEEDLAVPIILHHRLRG